MTPAESTVPGTRLPGRLCLAAIAVVLAVVIGTAGCGSSEPEQGSSVEQSRVTATARGMTLDGKPWWPIGFAAYQLGTDWQLNEGCGAQVDLDKYFGSLPPNAVTRFNLFSSFARDKDTGEIDFGRLDKIFQEAADHDQMLVAVLSAGEGACEDSEYKDHSWFVDRWDDPATKEALMPYVLWLDTAVARWGSSRALAGWELVGEAEPSNCNDSRCSWQNRLCPPRSAEVLRKFFDVAGARLRALDPDTPIWAGLAGGGQCGSRGDEYQYVAASPGIDVLDYHDYGPRGEPLPGTATDGLQRRIQQAGLVGKPLVVAEMGQMAGSCGPLQGRADDLTRKITAQRAAGTAGALFWAFVPDPRLGECTLDIGPGDPIFAVIRALSP
ncbi:MULTISPECIES: hypothetical protein [Actinomycetes]|uniref:hypothetical protein n=1 Tax=Actinomycetes TaxID=1760 RepID=UPI000AA53CFD|nr:MULTISPECIES: hypothetical protein [Actinomycetes]